MFFSLYYLIRLEVHIWYFKRYIFLNYTSVILLHLLVWQTTLKRNTKACMSHFDQKQDTVRKYSICSDMWCREIWYKNYRNFGMMYCPQLRLLLSWRCWKYVSPKRRNNSTRLHGITSHKAVVFVVTSVITWYVINTLNILIWSMKCINERQMGLVFGNGRLWSNSTIIFSILPQPTFLEGVFNKWFSLAFNFRVTQYFHFSVAMNK